MTVPRVRLIEPGDLRWTRSLAAVPHDFYHLPAYAELAAREDGGIPVAVLATADRGWMLLPLVIREIPGGGRDASSPYGYPGPLLAPGADVGFLAQALQATVTTLAGEGLVSLFVRMHPLLSPTVPRGIGTVVQHPPTVVIDLDLSDEDWRAGLRKSHRQQIERAVAAGHHAYMDTEWRHFDHFKDMYRDTMARVQAADSYRFSDTYFDELRAALGAALHLCVVERGGRVWAAGLFTEMAGLVQSHLSADDGSYRRGGAKKLLYAHVRDWAMARGDRWLHLGGGGSAGRGLHSFKTGFSPDRRPFRTLRVVLREAEYGRLVAQRRRGHDPADLTGYFPAYRQVVTEDER